MGLLTLGGQSAINNAPYDFDVTLGMEMAFVISLWGLCKALVGSPPTDVDPLKSQASDLVLTIDAPSVVSSSGSRPTAYEATLIGETPLAIATALWHGLKRSLSSFALLYLPCFGLAMGLIVGALAKSKLIGDLVLVSSGESYPWDMWLLSGLVKSSVEAVRGLSVTLDPMLALGAACILCPGAGPVAHSWMGRMSRRESNGGRSQ